MRYQSDNATHRHVVCVCLVQTGLRHCVARNAGQQSDRLSSKRLDDIHAQEGEDHLAGTAHASDNSGRLQLR